MPTTIRCKFKVSSITHTMGHTKNLETGQYGPAPVATARLNVVGGGTPENDAFFAATPNGQIDVSVIRMEHADTFAIGKEFYVDFTPAT